MKNTLKSVLAVLVLVCFGTFAEASNPTEILSFDGVEAVLAPSQAREPLEKGMFFQTPEACQQAYAKKEFRYYVPDPKNIKPLPVWAKGLPGDGCALEDVRESKAGTRLWVILPAGNPTGFDENGNPNSDARCYNNIHEFIRLEATITSAANAHVERGGGDINVTINNNPAVPAYEQREPFQPSTIFCQNIQAKNYNQPGLCRYGGGHTTRNVLIGVGVVALGTGIYFATKDDDPGVDTKGKCVATSYPNNCPKPGAPGVGASSAPQGFFIGFVPQGIGFSFTIRR